MIYLRSPWVLRCAPHGSCSAIAADHAHVLLDATFYDDQEPPGRDMSLIPHPRVTTTVELLAPIAARDLTKVRSAPPRRSSPL